MPSKFDYPERVQHLVTANKPIRKNCWVPPTPRTAAELSPDNCFSWALNVWLNGSSSDRNTCGLRRVRQVAVGHFYDAFFLSLQCVLRGSECVLKAEHPLDNAGFEVLLKNNSKPRPAALQLARTPFSSRSARIWSNVFRVLFKPVIASGQQSPESFLKKQRVNIANPGNKKLVGDEREIV